ncbi:uncharacterized protein LOC102807910 [Saccoglossus kowalevskii]|uniref:Autophagy-related protein 27 n=1 Tax=Saccoglossus kowalevskii TaxID=10224 RepID=A0ABM0MGF7_SACKO|nr:PREDICTED: uncharacterized protein LOC102807910 [Saccoglossus kowalevskii]
MILTSLATVTFVLITDVIAEECKFINSCSCKLSNGGVIDLSPLANTDGTARFANVLGDDLNTYSYNPCFGFTEESDCTDVACCQESYMLYYNCGTQDSASFSMQGNDVTITYKGTGTVDPLERTSKVKLICTPGGITDTLHAYGSADFSTNYDFDLSSKYCCPIDGGNGGLSAGSVLCIIAVVLVVVYLIGGILFNKFIRHAEGSDVIPNKQFWAALPALIKDGFLFAISPCRKGSSPYSSIDY